MAVNLDRLYSVLVHCFAESVFRAEIRSFQLKGEDICKPRYSGNGCDSPCCIPVADLQGFYGPGLGLKAPDSHPSLPLNTKITRQLSLLVRLPMLVPAPATALLSHSCHCKRGRHRKLCATRMSSSARSSPARFGLHFKPHIPSFPFPQRAPRSRDEGLVSGWLFVRYSVIGAYVGIATVAAFGIWYLCPSFLGIDLTGDGHTILTWQQLSSWGTCPTWPDFHPAPFTAGALTVAMENPCDYFTTGKVRPRAVWLRLFRCAENSSALLSALLVRITAQGFDSAYMRRVCV